MYFLYFIPTEIKFFFKNILSFFLNVKITGEEFLDNNKNGIIVSNHLDLGDILIPLFYLDKPIHLLYPIDIRNLPLLEFLLNHNFVILSNMIKYVLISEEELFSKLKYESKNKMIFIFPEIQPSSTGIIQPFNDNIIQIIYECANSNQIPIIPSGIQGTYKLSELYSMVSSVLNRTKINFNVGNPINISETNSYKDLKEELQKQVYALSLHPERRKQSRAIIKTDAREL